MPKVTFVLPTGASQSVDANIGESLLAVGMRAGVPMEHVCGGFASCGTCHVKVKGSQDGLSPKNKDEQSLLKYESKATDASRLACQSKVQGEITVEVVNMAQKKAA